MNKVYVLGGAQTDFERNWFKENKSVVALLKEVIDDCLSNVNLSYQDIVALNKLNKVYCFIGNFLAEYYVNQGHLGSLLTEVNSAFYGVPSTRYEAACASGSAALDAAISKIRCGDCDVALVIGWELMKTVDSKTGGDFLGRAAVYEKEAKGIDFPFVTLFGQLTDEIQKKYSINENLFMDSLAIISNTNYQNAKRNNNAQTRKWFMNEKEAKFRGSETNPIISGRLSASDCSQVTDGAAAVVLISEKYLRENYNNKELPVVKGWGHRVAPIVLEKKLIESKDNKYILPWTRQTVLDSYNRANLNLQDIDFFETHDCFTTSEYIAISAFGITEPGKEYTAILNGDIVFNGKKPINPSGGLIGCGHPVGASGVRMFLDLFKQITMTANNYQLKQANNGMMLNFGGSATSNYVYIVGREINE